jgi:hypothetical protein
MRSWPAAFLLLSLACGKSDWASPEVSYDVIDVDQDRLAIKTGPVGHDQWKSEATYVLVEAKNTDQHDLLVTLSGELLDSGKKVVGKTRRESLRIPAGGSRLFALIDDQQVARPSATGARVDVRGAETVSYPAPVVVTEGNVYFDQDRAVVAGYVLNNAGGEAKAIVIGAFFDDKGRPMQRPSSLFRLAGKGKRGAQMVGPPGSRGAYLFIGDVQY